MEQKEKVLVGAISFSEMMKHGLRQGGVKIIDSKPGVFNVDGYLVTPDTDGKYLVKTPSGDKTIERGQLLVKFENADPEVWAEEDFKAQYPAHRYR